MLFVQRYFVRLNNIFIGDYWFLTSFRWINSKRYTTTFKLSPPLVDSCKQTFTILGWISVGDIRYNIKKICGTLHSNLNLWWHTQHIPIQTTLQMKLIKSVTVNLDIRFVTYQRTKMLSILAPSLSHAENFSPCPRNEQGTSKSSGTLLSERRIRDCYRES